MRATILMLALCLSGCAMRPDSIAYADLPPSLLQPCAEAVRLPARNLTRAEVVAGWATDRRALAACRSRHGGLVAAVR